MAKFNSIIYSFFSSSKTGILFYSLAGEQANFLSLNKNKGQNSQSFAPQNLQYLASPS
jgi:hypothetical protein